MSMYFVKQKLLRTLFRWLRIKPTDMPMVQYWKTKEAVQAKVMRNKDGATVMKLEGEPYEFPGFPRGYLLFGVLSKFKHQIKTRLFNDSWWALEAGKSNKEVTDVFKAELRKLRPELDKLKYDMQPPSRMYKPVKEVWRALTVLEKRHPESAESIRILKEAITFVLTEDDAYRFRFQWVTSIFPELFRNPIKSWSRALTELENAEIIGDMKDRVKLFKRISLLVLTDKRINQLFREFVKEMNWSKVKLSKADKFHFRGKYFKVDFDKFEY